MDKKHYRQKALWLAVALLLTALAVLSAQSSPAVNAGPPPVLNDDFELATAVDILLPDRAALNRLVDEDWDLDHNVNETDAGITVTVIATPGEIARLQKMGIVVLGTDFDLQAWEDQLTERKSSFTTQAEVAGGDTITILRADYSHSAETGDYISVEAKSSEGNSVDLTASWTPAPIFGITCSQAVGLGQVPAATFQYFVRLQDPGTNSGSGNVTNKVWQGTVHGPAPFDIVVDWPITPSQGDTADDSTFEWSISDPGGNLISEGAGSFVDCNDPLPVVPNLESDNLNDFNDAGQYLYHRGTDSVDGRPTSLLTVTSSGGGSAMAAFNEWLPSRKSGQPYQIDYVDSYMDPTQLYARIESLAAEFPDLAEIIELPNLTNGYRRQAQGMLGDSSSSRVVITSWSWGHEGGNDIIVEAIDPGIANQPLAVNVSGNTVSIYLATAADGSLISTAAELRDAINADTAAAALVYADPYRENPGGGIVPAGTIQLSDFLNAPPEISREPMRVRALRIGRYRDGSRVGVLAYAQEHAREWVPPLVTVETAERLLRNYASGPSKQLLDNLDIFIIPSVNPDGGHYSFYDYAFQRKNMVNYCPRGDDNDPNRRNQWGVDINRNYDVGSIFDGYTGASTNCRGTTFAGPSELSEPESRNVVWLADNFENIRFSMNIHSSGNYFMWSPGTYIVPGRISLPRPTLGEESFFWYASDRILQAIKTSRGLAVTPGRTGPIVDVLYSAAGNSGDRLWYANNFYAWNFEVGTSFQPSWPEAHAETLEFSNGLIELINVALDFSKDNTVPKSWLADTDGNQLRNPNFDGQANVRFANSEPATIYYTLDGSRPDYGSQQYATSGLREAPAVLSFNEDSVINWFAEDAAGNISKNFRPDDPNSNSFYSQRIVIR